MNELDPQHLFYDSPYPVKLDDGEYIFRTNPDIMLYMCDSANDQQAQRNRLSVSILKSPCSALTSRRTALNISPET